VKHKASEGK